MDHWVYFVYISHFIVCISFLSLQRSHWIDIMVVMMSFDWVIEFIRWILECILIFLMNFKDSCNMKLGTHHNHRMCIILSFILNYFKFKMFIYHLLCYLINFLVGANYFNLFFNFITFIINYRSHCYPLDHLIIFIRFLDHLVSFISFLMICYFIKSFHPF